MTRFLALSEEACAGELRVPTPALAKACSLVEGGQWLGASGALVWVNGREARWLVDWRCVEGVTEARAVCERLGVPVRSWTLGGVARQLLEWTGVRHRHLACSDPELRGVRWAYQRCVPGEFPACVLSDLTGAYHQVVRRLPSPCLDWLDGKPCWRPLGGEEAERWALAVRAAAKCKPLRTRLLGCMIGGGRGCVAYHRGELVRRKSQRGPLVTAGLLVARTVYELCALQANEDGALYANTDCVVTVHGERRAVWERYGYPYRTVARGEADIVSLGCYRVGEKQTRWYGAGGRFPVAYPADPLPARLTLQAWH